VSGSGGQSGTGGTAGGSAFGQGGSGNSSSASATLCDGSEDVRLTYLVEGGFLDAVYGFFSDVYGHRSFAIDGQCRFWRTRAGDGWVYTGTLEPDQAQEFAEAIGYGELSDYAAFDDPPCPDGSITTLAAPVGQIRCSCQCTTNPDAPARWLAAFRAVSLDAQDALFANGETVTGPAQMVLVTPRNLTNGMTARTWPLARDPDNGAFVVDNEGALFLTHSSGVLVEDADELAALRRFRAEFAADLLPGMTLLAVPVFWANANSAGQFDLLLRDEVPEKVRAALESAAQ
jgi:hypothetical protein